jgi:GLPGLI family protein
MRKLNLIITLLLCNFLFSQTENKILKINYNLIPISQHYFNHDASTPQETKDFDIALRTGYNFNYSLYYNLKEKNSFFVLDTLIVTKVKGKEDYWTDPENKINFCKTNKDGSYQRMEKVFDQEVYVNGKNDIQWEFTNETREILGYQCTKAVSKDKDLLLTVWFTKEIPIQAGPSMFNNLPGLVLWAEDYFSTISVNKISYETNDSNYNKAVENVTNKLKKIEDDDFSNENVFLLRKSKLVSQLKLMR